MLVISCWTLHLYSLGKSKTYTKDTRCFFKAIYGCLLTFVSCDDKTQTCTDKG